MNRYTNQKGSAHAVVIIVLVAALILALGWIFWQNFILKEPKTSDTKPVIVKQHDTAPTTKTYTDKASGVSFDYPSDWKIEPMNMDGSLMVTVRNQSNKVMAWLETNLKGLGGAGISNYTTLATVPLTGSAGGYNCLYVTSAQEGAGPYTLEYGTNATDACAALGSGTTGIPIFALDTKTSKLGMMSFSNFDYIMGGTSAQQRFTTLDAAKQYVSSDEYKQIQTMIGSLKY